MTLCSWPALFQGQPLYFGNVRVTFRELRKSTKLLICGEKNCQETLSDVQKCVKECMFNYIVIIAVKIGIMLKIQKCVGSRHFRGSTKKKKLICMCE